MGVDDPRQLLVAALERDRVDEFGDHVAGAIADDVGADDLAVLGVDDELDDAVAIVVDGAGADAPSFIRLILTSLPASLACCSVMPTLATCG